MKKILIIGLVWPEPTSTAAGTRMMRLISLFQKSDFEVIFSCAAEKSERSADLTEQQVKEEKLLLNSDSFDDFISKLQPSVVLFDRFISEEQFGWRVAKFAPNALRVLDTEDLHFVRKAREEALKNNTTPQFYTDHAKREIASIYRCDLSLIISSYEMTLLQEQFQIPKSILYYLPILFGDVPVHYTLPSFHDRSHFMTIGNFRHAPNMDAVNYLKSKVWPLIRKELPKAELHIYGSYVSEAASQLHKQEDGFLIKGTVDSSAEVFLKSKICLAPLRFGAGLKGKLLEAMLCGTPSVTSEIGAEGIGEKEYWGGTVASSAEEQAKAAVELYSNQSMWEKAQLNGLDLLKQRFTDKALETDLIKDMSRLSEALVKHRMSNFMGEILQFHTLRSTEFMSRWIAEKNNQKLDPS